MRILPDEAVCEMKEAWESPNSAGTEYDPVTIYTCKICGFWTRFEEDIDAHMMDDHDLILQEGSFFDTVFWGQRARVLR